VTIEFKEFGVRLAFTPTVIGDKISLVVSPEVSELDPQNGIELNNVVIPGLRTRKATTTVELKNGQSFAIAGLIQKDFLDDLTQLPGLGSAPIIGALARSARYQRSETELAIIITPYIVVPSDSAPLELPTDYFTRPHEFELFFLGQTEGGSGGVLGSLANILAPSGPASTRTAANTGAVGYVLE
jgi:pilus assembly protein CpaC